MPKTQNTPAQPPAPLPRQFYDRDPQIVARELLGKVLLRRERHALLTGRIVETEAYLGADDPAAHAAVGRTARNDVLFGPPGRAYVYLAYGNHWCLNVSTLPDGIAGGVLFRAVEPLSGLDEMARARGIDGRVARLLACGPGRLGQAFGVTRSRDNGKDMADATSDLVIVDDGFRPQETEVTTRIGITKAVEHPLRFVIPGNAYVSRKR